MSTPLRKQYLEVKSRYADSILLFRLGDFYETFDEDAKLAARDLEITLTRRDMGGGEIVPMAGIPHHAIESYLGRLIRRGHRVAICEQLTDPTPGKALVERDVVRVVTRGTVLEESLLEEGKNNYLAALNVVGAEAGLAYVDITTGEFVTTQLLRIEADQELARLAPVEVLVSELEIATVFPDKDRLGFSIRGVDPHSFSFEQARERLLEFFETSSLAAYGCEETPLATCAAGGIIEYLTRTQGTTLNQLQGLRTYRFDSFMAMDRQTRRNLELFEGARWGGQDHSLLNVLNLTRSPMGGRLLRQWLGQPLLDLDELYKRQASVEWFYGSMVRRQQFQSALGQIGDLERILHRIGAGSALPREVANLRDSLQQVPNLKAMLADGKQDIAYLNEGLPSCQDAVRLISSVIVDDPEGALGQGGVIRNGFSQELDQCRMASQDARSYIASLERRERERTGISSLKVGYNRVFGYYLEVTNSHLGEVPEDYVRRQTLAGAERYYTQELKEHENLVLSARERVEELESSLYRDLCLSIVDLTFDISQAASTLAIIDVLVTFGEVAVRNQYVKPIVGDGVDIEIKGGRHPIVEQNLPPGRFIPNDTILSGQQDQIMILTGPNMAGKSTYIRQVALLVLLAQIGSFVPADEAKVGLVDRIFTRIGLQDDLSMGQSTFMVEMVETASILHHATPRSLVVLDEIGRGTSTYDGLSIARAVAEHLHNSPRLGCRTLFATHYHELTELSSYLPRVHNRSVSVREQNGEIVFLHRIVPGGADRSYGVYVAKLAGLPISVVDRAWEILQELEERANQILPRYSDVEYPMEATVNSRQLSLVGESAPVLEFIQSLLDLDLNSMTPLDAINELSAIREKASGLM